MPKGTCRRSTSLYAAILVLFSYHVIAAESLSVTWEELEAQGAVIAGIRIEIQDVFPEEDPAAEYWFAGIANAVHIETKQHVVARELPFKVGDRVDAAVIHDAERSMRDVLDVIRDAAIVPERVEGNQVWVRVVFKDAWSLGFSVDYGNLGGENRYRLMFHERNFLGLGKGIRIGRNRTYEKTIDEVTYYDPQLLGSSWLLDARYQQFSEGDSQGIEINRPFRTFQTPWAVELAAEDYASSLTLYADGDPVFDLSHKKNTVDFMAAWAYRITADGVYRLGAGFEDREVNYGDLVVRREDVLPTPEIEDRHLLGVKVSWEWFDDQFQNFRNLHKIDRTEHYNLGWNLVTLLGYYSRGLGGSATGPFFETMVSKAWCPDDSSLFKADILASGRHESGQWRNTLFSGELFYYNQRFPMQTLAGYLWWEQGVRPDPENWSYLGAMEGLRGYPNHFIAGDSRWLLSIEDRLITNRILWGVLQLGFMGFVDMGAAHAFEKRQRDKIFVDVGFGFRLGNIRMRENNVIQLAIAFPLVDAPEGDDYKIVVGNQIRF
jgi:hypothetical protein